MPSSAPSSDPNIQPQNDTAAGANHLDRVQSELQAVKQQAQATQQALKKLQTHESVDPISAILGELPQFPAVDSLMLGLAIGLTVALALLWWFVWHRPKARLMAMPSRSGHKTEAPSTFHSLADFDNRATTQSPAPTPKPAPRPTVPGGDTVAEPLSPDALDIDLDQPAPGLFARSDTGIGFDSEAAASEVMRVRKSLAEKREARAQILEREDAPEMAPLPSVRAWLDSGISAAGALDATPTTSEPPVAVDPWAQPGDAPYGEPVLPHEHDDEAIDFSFSLPDESEDDPVVNVFDAEPAIAPDLEQQLMELELAVDADLARDTEPKYVLTPDETPEAALPEPRPEPQREPESKPEPENIVESAFVPEPELAPESAAEGGAQSVEGERTDGHDYAVTLALAQESAELQLWPEARDLAIEVLDSEDESLRTAAQDLLEQINHLELTVDPDTIPWDEPR